jgi:(R)-2-hydroxyacyl-CoA dehydratese activating ATPase
MAERVVALARRVKPQKEIMMTGGVAKNVGVKNELEKILQVKMVKPQIDPQIIGAYGAALFAKKEGGKK